jgi:hypothetical protein
MIIDALDPDHRSLRIQGGGWPGRILLDLPGPATKGSITIRFIHHALPAPQAVAAAEFLLSVQRTRELRIRLADGEALVVAVTLGAEVLLGVPELPVLRHLALVHEECGLDIRLPKSPSREFLADLRYTASALREGEVRQPPGTLRFTTSPSEAARIEEHLRSSPTGESPKIELRGVSVSVELGGKVIPLGTCVQSYVVTGLTTRPLDCDSVEVEVRFSSGVHCFDQRPPRPATGDPDEGAT